MKAFLCGLLVSAVTAVGVVQRTEAVVWQGTTSQDRPISFTIANGAVTSLSLDWVLPLDTLCAVAGSPIGLREVGARESMFFFPNDPGNEPLKISGRAFSLTRALSRPPASVKGILTGRFTSDTEASGTLALSSEECKASATVTWKAERQGTGTPVAVAATVLHVEAKRTKVFLSSGGQSLRAAAEAEDVVLVLNVAGISVQEFQNTKRDTVYVLAGERKCRPGIAISGVVNNKPTIQLAVVVPRSTLDMRLFVGTHPPVAFTAPVAVSESER